MKIFSSSAICFLLVGFLCMIAISAPRMVTAAAPLPTTASATSNDSFPYTTLWGGSPSYFTTTSGSSSGLQITYDVSVVDASGNPIAPGSSVSPGDSITLAFTPISHDALVWNVGFYPLNFFGTSNVSDVNTPAGSWTTGATGSASCTPSNKIFSVSFVGECIGGGGPVSPKAKCYQEQSTDTDIYGTFSAQPPTESLTNLSGLSCGALVNGQATCTVTGSGTLTPTFSFAPTFAEFYAVSSTTPSADASGNNVSGRCVSSGSGTPSDALTWEGTNDPSPSFYASSWTPVGLQVPINQVNIPYSLTVASSPGAFISANPTSISSGSASQLTYECTNSTSGSINQGIGSITADGQYHSMSTGSLSVPTTYTITCNGNGSANAEASAIVTVTANGAPPSGNNGTPPNGSNNPNNPSSPNNPTPTGPNPTAVSALLTADPLSVPYGLFSTLSWSSQNATSCNGAPVDFAQGGTSGSLKVFPLISTLYTLTCQDNAGNQAYDSQNVTVTAPSVSINATPDLVTPGSVSDISWGIQGTVNSCHVSGPGLSSNATSGSAPETITTQSVYTISCISGSYNPTQSVTVNVVPSFREF